MFNSLKEYIRSVIQEEFARTHNSKRLFNKFEDVPVSSQKVGGKPKGFWYGCDGSWERWAKQEMPKFLGKHNYKVQVDLSKMIVIRDYPQLIFFEKKYGVNVLDKVPGYEDMVDVYIDWPRVVKEYSGIEIAPYISKARERDWYFGWDVASGCVWEKSALKSVEKV